MKYSKLLTCGKTIRWFLVLLISLKQCDSDFSTDHKICGISHAVPNHRTPRRGGGGGKELIFSFPFTYGTTAASSGSSGSRRQPRIIQGRRSKPKSWPWQASIRLNISSVKDVGHWCGGVLVSEDWILTAAHCVDNRLVRHFKDESSFSVSLSWLDWHQTFPVKEVYIHPDFDGEYQNDLALLRLQSGGQTGSASPVCLPDTSDTAGENFEGVRCIATGWGRTTPTPSLDEAHDVNEDSPLKEVELKVVDTRHCRTMYGLRYNIPIGNDHLCAGPIVSGGRGTCDGDSGGPLHCNMADGRWYLAGVIAFGSGCAKPGFPDVFMRVTSYMGWIQHVITNHW